jgi:hypothetical protein
LQFTPKRITNDKVKQSARQWREGISNDSRPYTISPVGLQLDQRAVEIAKCANALLWYMLKFRPRDC